MSGLGTVSSKIQRRIMTLKDEKTRNKLHATVLLAFERILEDVSHFIAQQRQKRGEAENGQD